MGINNTTLSKITYNFFEQKSLDKVKNIKDKNYRRRRNHLRNTSSFQRGFFTDIVRPRNTISKQERLRNC